jgi:hypothetical protein
MTSKVSIEIIREIIHATRMTPEELKREEVLEWLKQDKRLRMS